MFVFLFSSFSQFMQSGNYELVYISLVSLLRTLNLSKWFELQILKYVLLLLIELLMKISQEIADF